MQYIHHSHASDMKTDIDKLDIRVTCLLK